MAHLWDDVLTLHRPPHGGAEETTRGVSPSPGMGTTLSF